MWIRRCLITLMRSFKMPIVRKCRKFRKPRWKALSTCHQSVMTSSERKCPSQTWFIFSNTSRSQWGSLMQARRHRPVLRARTLQIWIWAALTRSTTFKVSSRSYSTMIAACRVNLGNPVHGSRVTGSTCHRCSSKTNSQTETAMPVLRTSRFYRISNRRESNRTTSLTWAAIQPRTRWFSITMEPNPRKLITSMKYMDK